MADDTETKRALQTVYEAWAKTLVTRGFTAEQIAESLHLPDTGLQFAVESPLVRALAEQARDNVLHHMRIIRQQIAQHVPTEGRHEPRA